MVFLFIFICRCVQAFSSEDSPVQIVQPSNESEHVLPTHRAEQRRVNKKRQDKNRCDVMYIRLQGKVISHMLDLYIGEMEI